MTDREDEGLGAPEEPPAGDAEPEAPRKPGQIRFQDAETTTPRPPTLGEQRARRKALEDEAERERVEVDVAERKSKLRRRVLIGSGVTVGVVALVAVWYSAASASEVTANCVGNNDTISGDENYCDESYLSTHGGYSSGGFFFVPIPGGGYNQYHYYYGGSVGPGGRVTGGSAVAPSVKTTVKTGSGKTIQRGGFGVSSGGGGKSGGS